MPMMTMLTMRNESDFESKESDNEIRARSVSLEQGYVHEVYDRIANDLLSVPDEHSAPVQEFLEGLEPGSLVADVGCGDGKYLNSQESVFTLGLDRCPTLLKEAKATRNQCDVIEADNLNLPYRDATMDAVISVSVVHHFATRERRILALRELARILRIGGKLLIIVQGDHLKCESSDVLIPWYQNPKRKHNMAKKLSLEVNYDSNEDLNGCKYDDDDDDDDDVSVPSSDEEDALVPDEHWIYSMRAHQTLQDDKQSSSDTPISITKNESLLQGSTSVESCYGFVKNVLRRFSSQPTPSVLATEDFPYTIASEAKGRCNNSEPTSPIMTFFASETAFESSSRRDMESMIKNDIIELRNVDDHLETKIVQSCEEKQFPSAIAAHDVTSPAVSESSKELARSLSGFFKKFPTFWNKRNSLPVDASKHQNHVSHPLKHRSSTVDATSSHGTKLVRSKTTATCTLHFEPYLPLESVEEDVYSDAENEYYSNKLAISHQIRTKEPRERFNDIKFTADDIVNGNMESAVDSFYLYTDGNYFPRHRVSSFNKPRSDEDCENELLEYSDIPYASYPMYVNSKESVLGYPRRSCTHEQHSQLSHQNLNLLDEYSVPSEQKIKIKKEKTNHKKQKLIDTQDQIGQTFFNSVLCQTNDPTAEAHEYIDDYDDMPTEVAEMPISNKRTMNDDIEEVYGQLKTLRFDEWPGSPKRCKRTSYPNYQMVSSKTLGPFYDSDEEFEDQEVVLSSYYSMPELCKLADYYQEYIFPNKNYSSIKQTTDMSTVTAANKSTIMKDSLGNFILDDEYESKVINFEKRRINAKKFNRNNSHRNPSHRKLSDLFEAQEEIAIISESENEVEFRSEVPSADSQVVPQDDISPQDVVYRTNDKVQDFKRRHSLLKSSNNSSYENTNAVTHSIDGIVLDCEKCASYLMSDGSCLSNSSAIMPPEVEEYDSIGCYKTNNSHSSGRAQPKLLLDERCSTRSKRSNTNLVNCSSSSAFSKPDIIDTHNFDEVEELYSHIQQNFETSERTNSSSREGKLTSKTISFEGSNSDLTLAKNRRNLSKTLNEEPLKQTEEFYIQGKIQTEIISVDELFSFADVYSDLQDIHELDLVTSASRSPDDCLKNCELSKIKNADSRNDEQESLSILDATSFCVENIEGLNDFHELKTYSECVTGVKQSCEPTESRLTTTYTKNFSKSHETQNVIHDTKPEKDFRVSERFQNSDQSEISCSTKTNCVASPTNISNCSLQIACREDCTNSSSQEKQSSEKNTDGGFEVHSLYGNASDPCATLDTHRYFHLFQEHELEQLIDEHIEDLHVLRSFQHQFSRCVVAEKVQVWTI